MSRLLHSGQKTETGSKPQENKKYSQRCPCGNSCAMSLTHATSLVTASTSQQKYNDDFYASFFQEKGSTIEMTNVLFPFFFKKKNQKKSKIQIKCHDAMEFHHLAHLRNLMSHGESDARCHLASPMPMPMAISHVNKMVNRMHVVTTRVKAVTRWLPSPRPSRNATQQGNGCTSPLREGPKGKR